MIELAPHVWAVAAGVAFVAGAVKGVVGFAMPMVMISGLASVVSPEVALALLILPTLVTNLWQAARGGVRAAWEAAREHRVYLAVVLACIAASAQLVNVLPRNVTLLILGVPVTGFAILQLAGWRLRFAPSARRRFEIGIAAFAGTIGGISGVWGPPTVAYLTALDTEKRQQVRVQGVVYGLGALMLAVAHLGSGVLTAATGSASAVLLVPALLGLVLGFAVHDRIDQAMFRKATLMVLIVAGLNLIRRGLLA